MIGLPFFTRQTYNKSICNSHNKLLESNLLGSIRREYISDRYNNLCVTLHVVEIVEQEQLHSINAMAVH